MMVYVDGERCTGCGACVKVCPAGALALVDGVAAIDQEHCRQCEACIAVCPAGAILSVIEPDAYASSLPARGSAPLPIVTQPAPVATLSRTQKALPWVGAALAFVGREVVPWVAGALLDAWDRRANNNTASSHRSSLTASQPTPRIDESYSGGRRQFRHRGGR